MTARVGCAEIDMICVYQSAFEWLKRHCLRSAPMSRLTDKSIDRFYLIFCSHLAQKNTYASNSKSRTHYWLFFDLKFGVTQVLYSFMRQMSVRIRFEWLCALPCRQVYYGLAAHDQQLHRH